MTDYSRFLKVYANLPEKLRSEIVAVVGDEPYTWKSVYVEIVNETRLGAVLYDKLIKMDII